MARGQIIVDTARLDAVANQIEAEADKYKGYYTGLYGTVSDLQNAWSGEDNMAFSNQIEGFRDDFQRMEQLMRDYAAYLRKAANAYRATQDNIAATAKNLSQGS